MTMFTVANQVTLLRMLLIPAFVLLVVYGQLGSALLVLLVAGITDALDGLIARLGATEDDHRRVARSDGRQAAAHECIHRSHGPGTPLAHRLPLWLTILVISRDIVIVLTVTIVNLAVGRRTFRPSIWGKVATATYIVTGLLFMVTNYVGFECTSSGRRGPSASSTSLSTRRSSSRSCPASTTLATRPA